MEKTTFTDFLKIQNQWSLKTFGPGEKLESILAHIEKEIKEVRETPLDLIEWVDIMMLAMDGAFRQGYTPEQILEALIFKQKINIAREWPDKKDHVEGKPIEHIEK